jgi:hypothetical protein
MVQEGRGVGEGGGLRVREPRGHGVDGLAEEEFGGRVKCEARDAVLYVKEVLRRRPRNTG